MGVEDCSWIGLNSTAHSLSAVMLIKGHHLNPYTRNSQPAVILQKHVSHLLSSVEALNVSKSDVTHKFYLSIIETLYILFSGFKKNKINVLSHF